MKIFFDRFKAFKRRKYYKPIKYVLLVLLVIVFLDRCTWMPMPPWKETDPSKPGFKVENFEYEDYLSQSLTKVMPQTLSSIFPLDSKREFVEKVLLEFDNGSRSETDKGNNCYILKSDPKIHTIVDVNYPHIAKICAFYKDDKLINLTFRGTSVFEERAPK